MESKTLLFLLLQIKARKCSGHIKITCSDLSFGTGRIYYNFIISSIIRHTRIRIAWKSQPCRTFFMLDTKTMYRFFWMRYCSLQSIRAAGIQTCRCGGACTFPDCTRNTLDKLAETCMEQSLWNSPIPSMLYFTTVRSQGPRGNCWNSLTAFKHGHIPQHLLCRSHPWNAQP